MNESFKNVVLVSVFLALKKKKKKDYLKFL